MNWRAIHRGVLFGIAIATIVSGAVQMFAPGFVLHVVGGERTPASLHFFGIVGMFMALFGAMLCHALLSPAAQSIPLLWAALQKFGASAAVVLGIAHGIFASPIAWVVAGFDLFSGVLAFAWWNRTRKER